MTVNSKGIGVIGSKELIDFPTLGIVGVPAKIDTGADSSAIWASNIHEENGSLHFTLFDKASPFYTGEVLSADRFSVISIKNSFGHVESRYKVSLYIRLSGRVIRVRFTLANRENNSQPILIGRRTLHGKFLVDVSAKPANTKPRRMLLMSNSIVPSVSKFVTDVANVVNDLEITHATYDDVCFSFDAKGPRVVLLSTGEDIRDYDLVHFKAAKTRDISAAMARYLKHRGVKIVDDEFSRYYPYSSKLYQYAILAESGVSIPDSLYVAPSIIAASYRRFVDFLGVPFVLKGIHANKGDNNYLIHDEAEFKRIAQKAKADNLFFIGQKFIANDGDYRVLVFGRRISLVIYRSRSFNGTHLNNTSQGGSARIADISDLPTDVQASSVTAAKVLGLGIAGVDMVKENGTEKWYCFEVNDNPQITSGAFVPDKTRAFARYIEAELNK